MKRFFILCTALLFATSCLNNNDSQDAVELKFKYTKRVTAADGSTFELDYDAQKRVKQIVCAGETFGDKVYDIAYNIGTSGSSTTVAVKCLDDEQNEQLWMMHFNDSNNIRTWSVVDDESGDETTLTTFSYDYLYSTAYLTEAVDADGNITNNKWTPYALMSSVTEFADGRDVESLNFGYEALIYNLHTNVDLLMLTVPAYVQHWHMDPIIAMCINVFGMRSYYVPTGISGTASADSGEEDEAAAAESFSRFFSYDCDSDGVIRKIYSGGGDDRTLLYEIEYFES